MADRRRRDQVQLEYVLDRLLATKLERVYEILVPDCARRASEPAQLRRKSCEDSRDLRPRVIGAAEGREDHRQPDRGIDGLCPKRRLQRTG
jgi:hypothetical protein